MNIEVVPACFSEGNVVISLWQLSFRTISIKYWQAGPFKKEYMKMLQLCFDSRQLFGGFSFFQYTF